MKILIASDTYLPLVSGNVIVVDQTARELAKRGHKVFLVVPGTEIETKIKKPQKNLTVFYTRGFKNPLRVNSYLPLAGTSIWKFMRQVKPDVIHIHTPGPVGLIARRYGTWYQVPQIITVHGMPDFLASYLKLDVDLVKSSFNEIGWAFWRFILKPAAMVIAPAQFVANQLVKVGVKNKIEVVPFWIEIDWQLLEKLKKSPPPSCQLRQKNKLTFLYYGRLDTDKSIKLLIKAWAKSALARQQAQLLLVGTSKEKPALEALAKKLHVSDSIKFLGMVPDATYRQLGFKPEKKDCVMELIFDQADFFVIPSNIETQSITTYLAILFGLPVIGSSKGALPEAIQKTPYPELVFQADSVADLTKKIDLVIKKRAYYKKYQPADKLKRYYDKNEILNKLERVYTRVSQ